MSDRYKETSLAGLPNNAVTFLVAPLTANAWESEGLCAAAVQKEH